MGNLAFANIQMCYLHSKPWTDDLREKFTRDEIEESCFLNCLLKSSAFLKAGLHYLFHRIMKMASRSMSNRGAKSKRNRMLRQRSKIQFCCAVRCLRKNKRGNDRRLSGEFRFQQMNDILWSILLPRKWHYLFQFMNSSITSRSDEPD